MNNTDLEALARKWRSRAASHGRASQSEYDHEAGAGDAFDFCADELETALAAQAQGEQAAAGWVMVPREPTTGPRYAAGDWSRRNWEAALEDQIAAPSPESAGGG